MTKSTERIVNETRSSPSTADLKRRLRHLRESSPPGWYAVRNTQLDDVIFILEGILELHETEKKP